MNLLYLDITHVLHPSESTYVLIHGKSPWDDGHVKYEYLPFVERALSEYGDVNVVLSDWTPVIHGIEQVKKHLRSVAGRVVGTLYEDVTTKVRRTVPLRSGGEREMGYSPDDFRRMSRAQAVSAHVAWAKPEAWVVVTSEYCDWTAEERDRHVVLTDMVDALGTTASQDAFAAALAVNFLSDSSSASR
jgi:hypothetical protein